MNMNFLIGALAVLAFLCAAFGVGTSDFYMEVAQVHDPAAVDPWETEMALLIGAGVLAVAAIVLLWVRDRFRLLRGESHTFFPRFWLEK